MPDEQTQSRGRSNSISGKQRAHWRRRSAVSDNLSHHFRKPRTFSKPYRGKPQLHQQSLAQNVVVVHATSSDAGKIEIAVPAITEDDEANWESEDELAFLPYNPASEVSELDGECNGSGCSIAQQKQQGATDEALTAQPALEESFSEEEEERGGGETPASTWTSVPLSFLNQDAYSVPRHLIRRARNPHQKLRCGMWKSQVRLLNTIEEVEGT